MKKPKRITTAQAAKLMGKTPLFVREGMRRELLPIGRAMQLSEHRWTFYVSPPLLAAYIGVDLDDLWAELSAG